MPELISMPVWAVDHVRSTAISPPDTVIAELAPNVVLSMFPPLISKALPSISVLPAVNLPDRLKLPIVVAAIVLTVNILVDALYSNPPSEERSPFAHV